MCIAMKPKSNLNDGEELLGIYQDNSRWIDRLLVRQVKEQSDLVQK